MPDSGWLMMSADELRDHGREEALRLAVALVVEAPPIVEAPSLVEAPPASSGFGGSAHWGSFCLQLVFETLLVGRGVGEQGRRGSRWNNSL